MTARSLTQPYHLGIVVEDIETAMERYGRINGITSWMRLDTDYPATHNGARTHVANHNAFGRSGSLLFELVQPCEGDTPASYFLEHRGEGVFHMGFAVDDTTELPEGTAVCFEVLSMDPPRIVYLDTLDTLGYYIELVPRSVVDALVANVRAATSA